MNAVSVVIATYNRLAYIGQSIDSILDQELPDAEIIVIDDGSTDDTGSYLRQRYGDRLVYLRHDRQRGPSEARNTGIGAARGEFVAFQDSDDVSYPGRFEAQRRAFLEDDGLVLVGGQIDGYDPELRTIIGRPSVLAPTDFEIRFNGLFLQPVSFGASMVRLETVRRHGLRLNPAYPAAEDYDFVLRLLRLGRARNLAQPVLKYRCHYEQQTGRVQSRMRAIHAQLSRQRLSEIGIEVDEPTRDALEYVIANPVQPAQPAAAESYKDGLFMVVQSYRYLLQIADALARSETAHPSELEALKASLRQRCLATIGL